MRLLYFITILFSTFCFGQNNIVHLEIFGHSNTIFSVNYERLFNIENENLIYSLRTGLGMQSGASEENSINPYPSTTAIPLVGNIMYRISGDNFINLGIGSTALFSEDYIDTSLNPNIIYEKFSILYSLSMGYRYMNRTGGKNQNSGFYGAAYPMIGFKKDRSIKPSFGLHIGYVF